MCCARCFPAAPSPAVRSSAACRSSPSSKREARGAYTGGLGYHQSRWLDGLQYPDPQPHAARAQLEFRAGAGIVADSDWQRELAETRAKARGLLARCSWPAHEPAASWINGHAGRSIDCADRGLQYGDGLFETIPARRAAALAGAASAAAAARLRAAAAAIRRIRGAARPRSAAWRHGQQRCIVKVIVTRGVATRRGYAPGGDERPTRIVSRHEWPARPSARAPGLRVGLSSVRAGHQSAAGGPEASEPSGAGAGADGA